jgi:hypothetical protein
MGAYRPLRVRVEGDTAGYVGAAAAGFAAFAVFALFTSLAPGFVGGTLHHSSRALAGVVVLAIGMHTANLALFLIGGILANMGAGVLFKSAVGAVAAMSRPATRGEALAGLFLISFVGMAVPAVGIGVATHYISATVAVTWFTGALLALLATVGALTVRSPAAPKRTPRL